MLYGNPDFIISRRKLRCNATNTRVVKRDHCTWCTVYGYPGHIPGRRPEICSGDVDDGVRGGSANGGRFNVGDRWIQCCLETDFGGMYDILTVDGNLKEKW